MKTLIKVVHLFVFAVSFGMWYYDTVMLKNSYNLMDIMLFGLWGGIAAWYIQLPVWRYVTKKTEDELAQLAMHHHGYKHRSENRRRFRDSK